ncbi:MAG: LytTR family DNA-binding domain-containing protein [Arcanobacterium sp.]|nr:LytTR family DNA-binding domain-containing protein [Arcanobacterium sp.]
MNNAGNAIKVLLKIDPEEQNERVEIFAREYSEQIRQIEQAANNGSELTQLVGITGTSHQLIQTVDATLFFTRNKRVWVRVNGIEMQLRQRLIELEDRLNPKQFVRISQSEIVNLKHIQSLDFSIAGTISLKLKDKTTCYVSRRSLANFKRQLGL